MSTMGHYDAQHAFADLYNHEALRQDWEDAARLDQEQADLEAQD